MRKEKLAYKSKVCSYKRKNLQQAPLDAQPEVVRNRRKGRSPSLHV